MTTVLSFGTASAAGLALGAVGVAFIEVSSDPIRAASAPELAISHFGLGKAAAGASAPTLFALGTRDGLTAVWRSTDGGAKWDRINDDAHQWGLRFRMLSGDPRIFGRVYVATDGRGILYGDPGAR